MFFRILKCFVLLYCVSILVYPWVCNTKLFEYCYFRLCIVFIVCIGVSPPPTPSPPKTAPPLFHQALVKSENCPGPPFLGNSPPIYCFFLNPPSDRIASDFNRFNSTQDIGNDVLSLSTSFDNFFSSEFMFSEISVRGFSLISS